MAVEQLAAARCFGGQQLRYSHRSAVLDCDMNFSVFLPPQAEHGSVPVLYWLSGLTCTDENFVQKAGAQRFAAEHGLAIITPDTSPRGEGIPDDPDGAYDFGLGAGFYVNATQSPWADHYRMYDYVVEELPATIRKDFLMLGGAASISGHSMGGHGALTLALRNPGRYRSASAFSPICSPLNCPWGEKALANYLGGDRKLWREHDTVALVREVEHRIPVLVDQGDADGFLDEQLKTHLLVEAASEADFAMEIRMQPGYDHSYFFVSSFIEDHIRFHASHLRG